MQGSSSINEEALGKGRFLNVLEGLDRKPRIVSTSSDSSSDSQNLNVNGADTPLAGSDDEELHSKKREMTEIQRASSTNRKEQKTQHTSPSF